ncbi:hypothetical protein [Acrocarpospora sp. B8E8]|uniref:hypothetical protein n=1 Tax=Acrocarpospora sp. B8E8 TaxID=3153572 RepID=UPI00325E58DF
MPGGRPARDHRGIGKVVALDTPAGLIRRTDGVTVITFIPSRPVADLGLAALPAVVSVRHGEDGQVSVRGTDETVGPLVALLARHQITAHRLQVTTPTLDDAFLHFTERET